MSLSIGPFPNGFPVGPYPSLLSPSVSPTQFRLGYLGSFRLLSSRVALSVQLVPGHAGLPEMNGQIRLPKPDQRSPLPTFPAHWHRPLQRLDTLATLCRDKIFLTTPLLPDSFGFLGGTGPSSSHPL